MITGSTQLEFLAVLGGMDRVRSGAHSVDETITSFLMIVSLGATVGIIGGGIVFFFLSVLWQNLEEIPDEPEGETGTN